MKRLGCCVLLTYLFSTSQLSFAEGIIEKLEQLKPGKWVEAELQDHRWKDYPGAVFSSPFRYLKTSDSLVMIDGMLSICPSDSEPMFTLPVGYRPNKRTILMTWAGVGGSPSPARIDVNPDGTVLYLRGYLFDFKGHTHGMTNGRVDPTPNVALLGHNLNHTHGFTGGSVNPTGKASCDLDRAPGSNWLSLAGLMFPAFLESAE